MSLPLVGGMYHHGAAIVFDIPYAAFGQAVGMMSVDSGKRHALWLANQAYNNTPLLGRAEGKTPTQLFKSTKVDDNPKHWHPFGCPAYVLTPQLCSGACIHHKWKQRSELGIYLGTSPVHHRNVALILNPQPV